MREFEQLIISVTLQTHARRVFSVVETAAILGIGRSALDEFLATREAGAPPSA